MIEGLVFMKTCGSSPFFWWIATLHVTISSCFWPRSEAEGLDNHVQITRSLGSYQESILVAILAKNHPVQAPQAVVNPGIPTLRLRAAVTALTRRIWVKILTILFSNLSVVSNMNFASSAFFALVMIQLRRQCLSPVILPLCRLLAYLRLAILPLVWARTPN